MKQKVRKYHQGDGTQALEFAGRLVNLMGFNRERRFLASYNLCCCPVTASFLGSV